MINRAKKTRKYAEDILGTNNRSHFDTQRGVAKDVYQTNYDEIQNRFAQLQERLEAQREKSNLAYNRGLSQVADSSYDRTSAQSADLVNRGLTTSGLGDRITQADTEYKGANVKNLLETLGGDTASQTDTLSQGVEQVAANERNLNKGYSDSLGEIGASDLANQMRHNQSLASIAGGKDARDDANALAAAQRAANAATMKTGKSKEETDIEDYLKQKAITGILMGINPETGESMNQTDQQKAISLTTLFDVDGPKAVKAYNTNLSAFQTHKDNLQSSEANVRRAEIDVRNTQNKINRLKSADSRELNVPVTKPIPGEHHFTHPLTHGLRTGTESRNQEEYYNLLQQLSERMGRHGFATNKHNQIRTNGPTYEDILSILYGTR